MTIVEFIEARVEGLRYDADALNVPPVGSINGGWNDEQLLNIASAITKIVEQHKKWVVAIQSPTTFTTMDDYDPLSVDHFLMKATHQITFLTEEKYREQIGSEPPTAPMIKTIAAIWKNHRDYQENFK